MNQNPIEDVLDELHFSNVQKEGFWEFLNYAKTCQEEGNNKQLKSKLDEMVKNMVSEQ